MDRQALKYPRPGRVFEHPSATETQKDTSGFDSRTESKCDAAAKAGAGSERTVRPVMEPKSRIVCLCMHCQRYRDKAWRRFEEQEVSRIRYQHLREALFGPIGCTLLFGLALYVMSLLV